MATTSRKLRIYVAAESGGYAIDASASGSGYSAVRVLGPPEGSMPFIDHNRPIIETNYFTGRNAPTPHELGPDQCTLAFDTPLLGLAAAAAAAGSPAADDWLDILLEAAFGASNDYAGMAVTSSTGTTLTTGTSSAAAQDLLAVYDATLATPRTMWRRTVTAASPYTVNRAWDANPTSSGVAYGMKRYSFADVQGNSVSIYYELDGQGYTLLGGRVVGLKLSMPAGKPAKMSWTLRFDSYTAGLKASVPAVTTWAGSLIQGELAEIAWGPNTYAAKSVDVDFATAATDSSTVTATNMRSGIDVLSAWPTVSITPLYATSWETDFLATTARTLAIRFGAGVLASTVLNTACFWAESAQALAPKPQDDANRLRQQVQLVVRDAGILSGTTPYRLWQFARA